ncbi:energy-coupling factor ABC transporter permease [bacterium BFN5]|nr:energy-coupling factor ABC transporter permease [bacterium BFN5]
MHITEGFLPLEQATVWFAGSLPVVVYGASKMTIDLQRYPERKLLFGLAAAFLFILSSIRIPSVIGSGSHATGIGLMAILLGPSVTTTLTGIIIAFQALLLAHGGISTWGANVFSMGVIGAFTAWGVFNLIRILRLSDQIAVFLAAVIGDLATYGIAAGQLAWAVSEPAGGLSGAYGKFLALFAITQLPLALIEGALSVAIYKLIRRTTHQGLMNWPGR